MLFPKLTASPPTPSQDPGLEAYVSLLRATPEGGMVVENTYKATVLPGRINILMDFYNTDFMANLPLSSTLYLDEPRLWFGMNEPLGDMPPTGSLDDLVHSALLSETAATVHPNEEMSSHDDADQEPAVESGDAVSRQIEASEDQSEEEATIVDRSLVRKRQNTAEPSDAPKKPKTAPRADESLDGVSAVEINTLQTRHKKYEFAFPSTTHVNKVRQRSAEAPVFSINDSLTKADAVAKVQVSDVDVETQCTALEPPRLENQTIGEGENLEIQPESQPNETLREVPEKEPEAMVDVQGNGPTAALDGQHVEAVPLVETATQDARMESIEPDHEIPASEIVPMDLSTALNHEPRSCGLAVDTVPSVETHVQPSQTAQPSENRARSKATEATEAATPTNQELGSLTNPITIPDDPLIVDNNGGEPIVVDDADNSRTPNLTGDQKPGTCKQRSISSIITSLLSSCFTSCDLLLPMPLHHHYSSSGR